MFEFTAVCKARRIRSHVCISICNVWVLDLFVFGYLDLLCFEFVFVFGFVSILDLKPTLKLA